MKKDKHAGIALKINASNPKTWGRDGGGPAREPTGAYLAPGTIATVTVPKALVDKGYEIRVGAHSWDHSGKPIKINLGIFKMELETLNF